MKTALVTGAAGFIGSHLVERLLDSGNRVVAIDSLSWGKERLSHVLHCKDFLLKHGDIRDQVLVEEAFSQGPFDAVYHLAALHYIPYCESHKSETLSVNVVGTQVLLDAIHATPPRCVVFVSTADVYSPATSPHYETDPLEPFTTYGLSKLFGEQLVVSASKCLKDTALVIARLFNAFGPRETNPHVIPRIVEQLKEGSSVSLGSTWTKRDYVYVRDIVEALQLLGQRSQVGHPEFFNVGTGIPSSVEDIVHTLERILSRQIPIQVRQDLIRRNDRPHLQASTEKLRNALHWVPRYTLYDGLKELCVSEKLLSGSPV